MNFIQKKRTKLKAKRTFVKQGTCSSTFFHILNKEFGHPKEEEERAIDPLAGGILQQGYQCGMLWGTTMAIGAESYRRSENQSQSVALTIKTTQQIMESFENRTKSIECAEITKTDFNKKWSLAKYMLSGKFVSCFSLAGKWAPEALHTAREGLFINPTPSGPLTSCASEAVKKMGGTEEEMAMVAGFAGGMGLSGNACGALAAAIWKTINNLIKKENWKYTLNDPVTNKIMKKFYETTDYKIECHEICGKRFKSIEEHTEFINTGGCAKLIEALAQF
ncbi:MAG: C-GCAxxG-C-C family protein [Bacteroidales bacterium]|nr:C-GCAxxG-C-C family protein [Bacteroidales bacterium]MCF8402955.1 C-GCAxxG-C-C family protein [Bacteroidales bacterium]